MSRTGAAKAGPQAFLKARALMFPRRADRGRAFGARACMKARAMVSEIGAADNARMLRARLDFLITTLPITTWINPSWAALSVLPFAGFVPVFGTIAPWRLLLAVGLHVVNSFVAVRLSTDYRRDRSNDMAWLRIIIGFQTLIGASWGLFVWLVWANGNPVNNVLIEAVVVSLLWVYVFSRGTHLAVLLAVMTPTALLAIARFLYHPGTIAWPLTLIVAVTYIYSVAFAHITRLRYDAMLRTKFAIDDLAVELRSARDEALIKRFEAEAAILGFSDLIANERLGPVGTARYREYANDINSSGSHLLSLINDILDIAKIESGKMELEPRLLNPRNVIEQALLVVLSRAREKDQLVRAEIEEDAAGLVADERALKQIVINLTSNAVKFTPDGGTILVSGRRMPDGGYEIRVEDNGPGIPAELLDNVFVPFNQIDNRYSRQAGGTGLGLSLVRGLTNLHGGRAWIESEEGAGVKACVYFPPALHSPITSQEKERLRA
jgi:two-component system cell cycle sensor histidine kinase PleC